MRRLTCLFVVFVIGILPGGFVPSPLAWGGSTKPKSKRASQTKDSRRPEVKQGHHVSPRAARELRDWLKDWSPLSAPAAGLKAMSEALRTYVSFRYARRYNKAAKKRLVRIYDAFGAWNPKALYQKIRKGKIKPWFKMTLKGEKVLMSAPSKKWTHGQAQGGMTIHVDKLPRRNYKMQPFRVYAKGALGIPRVRIRTIDQLLRDFMQRALASDLSEEKEAKAPHHFPSIKDKRSRQIVDWLTSRLPRTLAILHRYFDLQSMLQPRKQGQHKLDLKLRWRKDNVKKDYPRWYKAQKKARVRFLFRTEFLDTNYQRWFHISFSSKRGWYRLQSLVHPKGFLMCDDKWNPTLTASPWRPTHRLRSDFLTRTTVFFSSNNITVSLSDIVFRWKVRPHKDGASMGFVFNRPPKLRIYGGKILRSLARLVIPGGVSNLFQKLVNGMTRGDDGKGLRFTMRLVELPTFSDVRFDLRFPIVPNTILSTVLRMIPRPKRVRSKRRRAKASRKNTNKKTRRIRRRRRLPGLPAFWHRVMTALARDMKDAHHTASTLASKP